MTANFGVDDVLKITNLEQQNLSGASDPAGAWVLADDQDEFVLSLSDGEFTLPDLDQQQLGLQFGDEAGQNIGSTSNPELSGTNAAYGLETTDSVPSFLDPTPDFIWLTDNGLEMAAPQGLLLEVNDPLFGGGIAAHFFLQEVGDTAHLTGAGVLDDLDLAFRHLDDGVYFSDAHENWSAWRDGAFAQNSGIGALGTDHSSAPDHDAGITPLDTYFDAKGGKFGGGGGGSTGGTGGGGNILTDYYSGSDDGAAGYDIWVHFSGSGWTEKLQSAFVHTADYFTTVITDDIGGGGLYHGKVIDDLYVSAELTSIDGTGGVLGQAGPTAVWSANDLTAAGKMQFDSADVGKYDDLGLWDDIVTHELMHVLGFGSLWNFGSHSLVTDDYHYVGQYGVDAYNKEFNNEATYIQVENTGGSGTIGSHWSESIFNNELMTGYINNDGNPNTDNDNYLSMFSVSSLADLGYHVNYVDYPYDSYSAAIA